MKLNSLLSLSAAAMLSVSMAAFAQDTTGKIHGKVSDPTGIVKTAGTVTLSQDQGHTAKYTFPVGADGTFSGSGIAPGTYSLFLRLPETPADKFVDQIDNVKIVAGQDLALDDDMSRKEYHIAAPPCHIAPVPRERFAESFTLLIAIARAIDARHFQSQLHKPRTIDPACRASAPKIRRVQ